MDDSVSRRQFFRGLAGDLLKVVGEVTGLAEEGESEAPRVYNILEGDVVVAPEKQAAALSDLFGFLEQLGAQKQDDEEEEEAPAEHAASPEAAEPEAQPAPAPATEAEHTQA